LSNFLRLSVFSSSLGQHVLKSCSANVFCSQWSKKREWRRKWVQEWTQEGASVRWGILGIGIKYQIIRKDFNQTFDNKTAPFENIREIEIGRSENISGVMSNFPELALFRSIKEIYK